MQKTSVRVQRAILQTLAYSHHFHFPLLPAEIHSRLIGIKITKNQVIHNLKLLVSRHRVFKNGDYYTTSKSPDLTKRRHQRYITSQKLLRDANKLNTKLIIIQSITAIFITGSLAVNNADASADIDLLIITKPKRLWTTRLLLTLFTTLLGYRRTPSTSSIRGKLCLNLYLTQNSLHIPESRHSLYTAYELIQVMPLYDPHNTYAMLMNANTWLTMYLPNYKFPSPPSFSPTKPPMRLNSILGDIFESLAYKLQYLYMKSKITREYITPDSAFFHPIDPSAKIKI